MADVTYKLFFDDEPATREQLDLVEEITVEQQLDMAWEGRFQIPICTDENGKWSQEDEDFLRSFGRVRLEVKVGDRPFQPLIDGPIVGTDNQLSSLPGQSMMTLIVQDDSVYLNREQSSVPFENMLDHEVATELFGDVETISSTDIETTPPAPDGLTPTEMWRGTQMALLRRLARRQGMHAYVLPGDQPGASIGAFKKLPRDPGDLPTLVLLGPDRNVHTFNVTNDAQSPSRVEAHALSVTDKTTTTARVSTRDLELLGEEGSLTREGDAGARMLQPGQDGAV